MTLKKFILKLHLILGLISGLVIFIVAITGCFYAFKDEIEALTQSYRYVEPRDQEYLAPSAMKKIGQQHFPGREIHGVAYSQPGAAAEIIFYEPDPEFYQSLFVNPYTGEILKVKDHTRDFFHFILEGHFYLWLPDHIGQPVVASATLIFIIMVISGLILWWPKKFNIKQRFRIKWDARWRRKNFDLHSVIGFYITAVVLVLAFTGLVWGFEWFRDSVYATAGGTKSLVYQEPQSHSTALDRVSLQNPVDAIWGKMQAEYPQAAMIEMHYPHSESSTVYANIKRDQGTYWRTDYRFFDQYTLDEIRPDMVWGRLDEANFADKLIRLNYDVHTGAIFGLPGKILMFFASLLTASLPITGVLLWIGRNRKDKKRAARPAKSGSSRLKRISHRIRPESIQTSKEERQKVS